jgi:hypothetical protein
VIALLPLNPLRAMRAHFSRNGLRAELSRLDDARAQIADLATRTEQENAALRDELAATIADATS